LNVKAKTVLLAAMIVTVATIPLLKSSPVDFEQCSNEAARAAKTPSAFAALLSGCKSKFAGRRKPGGGYTYLDPLMDQEFDIKGPNPTKEELEHIAREFDAYIERKNEAESAKLAREVAMREEEALQKQRMKDRADVAAAAVRMTILSFDCSFSCSNFDVSMKIKNESGETLSQIWFGWALIPKGEVTCPTEITGSWSTTNGVRLPPGGSAVLNTHAHVPMYSAPSSFRLCGKVIGARIAEETARAQ
jgi:hypothetical protein